MTVTALVFALVLLATAAQAQPAPGPPVPSTGPSFSGTPRPSPTQSSPIPGLGAAGRVLGRVGEVATGEVSNYATPLLFAPIAKSLQDGVEDIIAELSDFIDETTQPHPLDPAFLGRGGPYQTIASFSTMLLIGFICLGVAFGVVVGQPGQVLLRLIRDIPLVVLAIIGLPWIVGQLVDLADVLSEAVLPTGATAKKLLTTNLLENLRGLGNANIIPAILVSLLSLASIVLVYMELVVRVILLQLVEALAPLSFAPMVWPPARNAAHKVAELTVAIILSEPAIFLALRIGLDFLHEHATTPSNGPGAWGQLLLGLCVVGLAAFSPWVIWRLLPHAEGMLLAQGLSHSPARGAMSAMQTTYFATALGSSLARLRTPAATSPAPGGPGLGPPRSLPDPVARLGRRPTFPSAKSPSGTPRTPAPSGPNPADARQEAHPPSDRTTASAPPSRQPASGMATTSTAPARPAQRPSGAATHSPPSRRTPTRGSQANGIDPGWARRRPPA